MVNIKKVKTIVISMGFFLGLLPIVCGAEQQPPRDNPRRPITEFPSLAHPDALSIERPKLPDVKPGPPSRTPEFRLPPVKPVPEKDQRLSTAFRVFVQELRFTGNTVFSDEELKKITHTYENRIITSEQLQQLRHTLTRYYIDHGYINSGVVIPDQEVKDGFIQLRVIEGELSAIEISGNDWLRSAYIDKRLAQGIGPPLNIEDLQERLLLLQQDPLIERINAELRPGLKPGQSRLSVFTTEARPYEAGVVAANSRSPSIGSVSGKIWFRHRNLTGFGDALYFSYALTDGLDDFFGSYDFPLTSYDTHLNLYYQNSESDVVENPFADVGIRSRSEAFGISLTQPFYRTPGQTFSMSLAFEYRRSKTFILDGDFPFAPGVSEEGESKISVIRFTQNWLDRSQTQVIAARSTFNLGIDVLGTTNNSDLPDSQFFVWLGQFQWIKRLPWLDSQVLFRTDLQLAYDPLLPLEKFSIGGMHSVRGYRENQFVRDNGVATSLEWRVPVFRLPIPGLSKSISDGEVQVATFADFGWSENRDFPVPSPKTIGSWGLGFRWDPSRQIHSEFYWGVPFRTIREGSEHEIQDFGIHFLVSAQL